MELWPHQTRALEELRRTIKAGRLRPLVVMPTGSGKSVFAATCARNHIKQGGTVLVTAHREVLIRQLYETFKENGVHAGCIYANATGEHVNPHRPVQIASLATLVARGLTPPATMVIGDEAHHLAADGWGEYMVHYKNSICLGLTATPERGDGRPLDFYNALIVGATVAELTDAGILVPCEIIGPSRALKGNEIAQNPVDAYLKHAKGKKTICFVTNTKAGDEFLAAFTDAGVRAAFVNYKTPNQAETIERFKRGEIDVLLSIMVLTEGFDDKSTECCIMARTCGSTGLWLQCVGRILRSSPGKTSAVLLDLTGQAHVHGPPEEDREYSLSGKGIQRKSDPSQYRFCAVCGELVDSGALVCEGCLLAKPEMASPEILGLAIAKFAWVRKRTPEQKKAHYSQMIAKAKELGHHPGAAWHKFKAVYGHNP